VLLASAAIFLGDRLRFARLDLRDTPRLAAATRLTSFGLDFTPLLDDRSVAPFDVDPRRCDFHERYGLARAIAAEDVSDTDRSIALASSEQLAELVRRAGAIYWANSIANTIRAADAAAFDAALGEALCVVALANRDLSGPMQPLTPYDQLGTRVMEDGLRCLGAWCKAQTAGVGLRVRLKLAPNPALDDAVNRPFDELGPAIVRRTVD